MVFESLIPNSTLRRRVFAIKTTKSFHQSLLLLLPTEQKMGKRQKDRQKDKDEDTSAQRQRQNTGQIMFEENLWCLTQTPQILVKFHIFWIEDLDGEWC